MFPVVLSAISLTASTKGAEGISAIVVFRNASLEKAVDEAKTEFISLAAHQLRMPLTTVRWYSEMLLSGDAGDITEKQHEYIDEISESNRRMVGLVNQLLSVSRIRLGAFKIDPVPTDVGALVDSVLSELKPGIEKKHMQIVKKYGTLAPFSSDPELLRVVFQNLVSNAIKYTPAEGAITIDVREGDEFVVEIADNGYGIPHEDQSKIFGQLYRADNIKNKDVEGSGLGLYMVKAIVDEAGGAISFTSEENKGTTFRVTFPSSGMRRKEGSKSLA